MDDLVGEVVVMVLLVQQPRIMAVEEVVVAVLLFW